VSPIVVMAHGTSGTLTMVADQYAEVFHDAGLAALLYDHRGFGISGGEPRQELNGWVDARNYMHAVSFASTLPGIDPSAIALWGASYSANLALIVAAVDERPAAVVAGIPAAGATMPPPDPDGSLFEALKEMLLEGDIETGERVGPMPIVSPDQASMPSLLPETQAHRWFIEHGEREGSGWVNEITRVDVVARAPLQAGIATPHVRVPVFATIAVDDEMGNAVPAVARAAFDAIPGPKELLETRGGHFAAYWYPSDTFDQVSSAQRDFLLRTFDRA
jgi:pimeloyl-ACP methyl ester carboxylesterase